MRNTPVIDEQKDAPRIEAEDWVRATSRRVESSLSCDWTFGFVAWNYLFRSSVNVSRSVYAYERKDGKATSANCTPASLEEGAIEVAKALWGKYTCVDGNVINLSMETRPKFVMCVIYRNRLKYCQRILSMLRESCQARMKQDVSCASKHKHFA